MVVVFQLFYFFSSSFQIIYQL